jgi:hypothetical protein
MAYKPKTVAGGSFGSWLTAKVSFNPDKTKVRVVDKETAKEYILSAKNVPAKLTSGEWVINLSEDKKEVTNYRPVNGMFKGKVIKFAAAEGEKPAPKTKSVSFKKDGKNIEYDYLYFTAMIQITEGACKGIEIPYVLRYNFVENDEDGKAVVAIKGKGKYSLALDEFLDVTGAWERGAMKWSDNVLPMFEKRILSEDRIFSFVIKKGWIDSFFAADAPSSEPDPDEEPDDLNPPFEADVPDSEPD